jgi:hypothetical protein
MGLTTVGASNSDAFGNAALAHMTSGNANLAIGNNTLFFETIGQQNTAVGIQALSNQISENYNTAVGCIAGQNMTSGDANTFVGCGSGSTQLAYNGAVLIGYNADNVYNDLTDTIAIGTGATVNASYTAVIGASGINVGLGGVQPRHSLCFQGDYAQTPLTRTPNTITDLIKAQQYGSTITDANPFIIFSYQINPGVSTNVIASNFYKFDLMINSDKGGAVQNSSFGSSSICAMFQVSGSVYSMFGPTNFVMTNQDTLVANATWSVAGTQLFLTINWNDAGQAINWIMSYETFGCQN